MRISQGLILSCLLVVLIFSFCSSPQESIESGMVADESKYPRMIGDIAPDSLLDNEGFVLCGSEKSLVQYYALGEKTYEGEKWTIERVFSKKYKMPKMDGESGLVRIRFVVNCEGKAGRFRLLAMDSDYNEKSFHSGITDQLLQITKSLDGWKTFKRKNGKPQEYYQYLLFKIRNGQLIEILP